MPATAAPPEGTAFVEVFSGSGFSGFTRTVVYADDSLWVESAGPGGEGQRSNRQQGRDGVFAQVAAIVAAKGPKVARKASRTAPAEICMDYGADSVRAEPAIGGFSSITVNCPDAAVTEFMATVLSAIPPP